MSNQRTHPDPQHHGQSDGDAADDHLRSREGDPRKRAEQDIRTTGERDRDRADDDPSRAPESGTP